MISHCYIRLLMAAALVLFPAWAAGQSPRSAQREMQAKLENNIQRHDRSTRDLAATRQELVQLESRLIQAKGILSQLNRKEADTAARLLEMKPRLSRLASEVDQGGRKLNNRLRVLYLYGPDISWWRMASARDFHDALTRSVALTRLAQSEKRHLKELNQRRQKLSALRSYLRYRHDELSQIKADKLKQAEVLHKLLTQRKELSARLKTEQEASERAIATLEEALVRLGRTFDLDDKTAPRKEDPVRHSESKPEAEPGPSQAPGPDAGGPAPEPPAPKAKPGGQPQDKGRISGQSEPKSAPIPTPGSLSPPVDGRVVGTAGPGERGIKVQARPHAPVRSPWWGRVVYAGVLAGYGHLVVVDHGNRVHTVMGYLEAISIEAGNKVEPGSVLGNLDKAGQLYLEVRKEARPQDPQKWLRLNP